MVTKLSFFPKWSSPLPMTCEPQILCVTLPDASGAEACWVVVKQFMFPGRGPFSAVYCCAQVCFEARKIHAHPCSWCPFIHRLAVLWNGTFQSGRILTWVQTCSDGAWLFYKDLYVFLNFTGFFFLRQVVSEYIGITIMIKCFLKLVNAVLLDNSSTVLE